MDTIRLFNRTLLPIALCIGLALTPATFAADPRSDAVAAKIKAMDSNGDGLVSAAEYAAHAKAEFDAMDANHDGQLTADEIRIAYDADLASGKFVPGMN
jgi:EF hand